MGPLCHSSCYAFKGKILGPVSPYGVYGPPKLRYVPPIQVVMVAVVVAGLAIGGEWCSWTCHDDRSGISK
ncbi:hypothetical protein AKJ16_DCAP02855 [Drosera capensis]